MLIMLDLMRNLPIQNRHSGFPKMRMIGSRVAQPGMMWKRRQHLTLLTASDGVASRSLALHCKVLALPLFAVSWALFNVWRVAFRQAG